MGRKTANPNDYTFIRAWGKQLGSYDYYIENEQRKAMNEGAPLDAVFKAHDNSWVTVKDIENADAQISLYIKAERNRQCQIALKEFAK